MRTLSSHPGFVISLLTALLLFAPLARAEDAEVQSYFNAVNRLYQNLENERALETLMRAKKFSRGPDDDALISFYEGIILADLGRKEDSQAAFKTGLFLRPDAKLPLKVSPKVERDFESLRAVVQRELAPLRKRQEEERLRKQRVQEEEERMAAAAKAAKEAEALAARPASGAVPAAALQVSPPMVRKRSPTVLTWVLGGAALAAGGTGTYFGLSAKQSHSSAQAASFQSERTQYVDESRSGAMKANVLFATAGAAATGALLSYLFSGDEAPAPAPAYGN
jgi:tetratricopeptide (TPR) repeat protein